MLKILVCVKQIPDVDLVKMDPETGNLIRTGVPTLTNPLDLNALEAAVQVKERYGGEITLITMGPPAAESTLRECLAVGGNEAVLITGRPFSSYEPSRLWLDRHGLDKVSLYCLDKYGRENFIENSAFSLTLNDYRRMKFDYAIEDSPLAFRFFDHLPQLKVMVFDRPWNREAAFPDNRFRRCCDWETIRANIPG